MYKLPQNILLLLTFFLLLSSVTSPLAKCNRQLLNEFGLAGIEYAIHDHMDVCRNVLDKCCSLYDEVRIYKFWNEYTKPVLDTRLHSYMTYTRGIVRQFNSILNIDPQLMVLKYHVKRKVPYAREVCDKRMKEMGTDEEIELKNFDDTKATLTFAKLFYADIRNKKRRFDPKKHTHDKLGHRHWGAYPSKKHIDYSKKFGEHGTASIFHEKTDHTQLECRQVQEEYVKDFIIVNEVKAKYCLGMYKKFLSMDNNYLLRYLPLVKNYLAQTADLKGSVYCSLCDSHQQNFFSVEKKKIMVQEHFCKSLIHGKKDLFNFMHVFFVEYMDSLMQYAQCFETDGRVFSFPFKNFMEKYKRRIILVKDCLDNSDKPNFMDKCWFICKSYKFFGVDWFYNGDVKLVKRVYLALFSFLHKLSTSEHEYLKKGGEPGYLAQDNVDGMLIEPLGPSYAVSNKYYLEDRTRKHILGSLDTRPKLSPEEKKKAEKGVNELLKKLGLPSIAEFNKLINDHKELKKKYDGISEVTKRLKKYDEVKTFFEKWNRKKKKDSLKVNLNKDTEAYLVNQLLKIKQKHQIHDGYHPQRELLEDKGLVKDIKSVLFKVGLPQKIINEKFKKSSISSRFLLSEEEKILKKQEEEELKLQEEEKKAKMKDQEKPCEENNRFKLNTVVIENANQIFEKNKQSLGVYKFEIEWGEEGIHPLKNFDLINYKFNITSLITKKIQEEERIADSVITTYLTNSSYDVNRFNFDADSLIYDVGTVTDYKYKRLKRVELYARLNHRVALLSTVRRKIKFIIKKNQQHHDQQGMFKELVERRKREKKAKTEKRLNKKNDAVYHVTQEHFHDNFRGFKKFFLLLFGN